MARKKATTAQFKPTRQPSRSQATSLSRSVLRATDSSQAEVANMPAGALMDNVAQAAEFTPLSPSLQTKLTVGAVGDPYEQEADRVARQVVNQLHSSAPSHGPNVNDATVQRQVQIRQAPNSTLQADVGLDGGTVSSEVESTIKSAKSGGQALSAKTQADMGGAMGADFSGVKVHTDSTSDQLNRSMQSRAFTTGSHVFFKRGEYSPSSRSGQELLAHELTHTVQQGASPNVQAQALPQQKLEPNQTGMSAQLKAGVESLSGMSMGDVKVHYNSPEPSKIGALAYTQGTDIHLAPKQEQHLAHEAWHVVQQKQGRVPVTTQFKKLAGNDSSALEHEADVMGAKAAAFTGTQPVGMVQQISGVQRQVVQARLPEMTAQEILAEPAIAQELLLHSMRVMEDGELQKMMHDIFADVVDPFGKDFDITEGREEVIDVIKNPDNNNVLVDAYNFIYSNLGDDKKFDLYVGDESKKVSDMQRDGMLNHLPPIVKGLEKLKSEEKILQGVFGQNDVSKAKGKITQTIKGIQKHVKGKTAPAQVFGDQEHLNWVGAAGYTEKGASIVKLSQKAINKLCSGAVNGGYTTLVHEFTHAAAGTKDHAYGVKGAAKLDPKQRVSNATTYQLAFLEVMGQHNPEHYYDKEVVSGEKSSVESNEKADNQDDADKQAKIRIRKHCAGLAKSVFTQAYGFLNNAYEFGREAIKDKTLSVAGKNNRLAEVKAATIPYEVSLNENNLDKTLALIEDRARFVRGLKKGKAQTNAIKRIDISDLKMYENVQAGGDSKKIIALAAKMAAPEMGISESDAEKLFTYLCDPNKVAKDYR